MGQKFTGPSGVESASGAQINPSTEEKQDDIIAKMPVLESNGGVPVNIQDQTSEPVDALFSQSLSNFTLSADTVESGVTTLEYTLLATTGHGIVAGNELLLLDVIADRSQQFVAKVVAGDTITIDRPIDHAFPAATTLGRITTSDMSVDGSITPQIFSLRAGTNPLDFTRFMLTMLGSTSMDDGKFGSLPALANGLVFRIVDGFNKTIFNFKTNQDIKQFCYDVNYSAKSPAGQYGLVSRISFGGQDKHGVVLRIGTNDVIQWVVQDDLSTLLLMTGSGQGHKVTD